MKRYLENLRRGKYFSLLALLCLAFVYASSFRFYVNESVYAAFDLGNLGEFGKKLDVSVLIAVLAALGWAGGLLTAYLTRKKRVGAVTLYWLAGMFAIVALFFTPYNLQLLMPSTVMQNIAMILCIAHILFVFVDMWLFAWAFFAGSKDVCGQCGRYGAIVVTAFAVVAAVLAYLSITFKWSFVVQSAVYGCTLTAVNVLHAAFPESDDGVSAPESRDVRISAAMTAVVTVVFAAVLAGAYFITENLIAI